MSGSERLDGALRLTALVLILDPSLFWFQRLPILVLAASALVLSPCLRSRSLWLGLALLTSWPLFWNWPFSDNHDYLRAFWCLAVWLSLVSVTPSAMLAWNGRMLIGLTFFFAVLWKAFLSPDFMDGRFFRVTLLTDGRFEELAVLVGGATPDTFEEFDASLRATLEDDEPFAFEEPPRLRALARLLTLGTIVSEAAVALCFLWPAGRGLARIRDPVLLFFALSTYAFATVRGFGWLLMTLGFAQTDASARRTRFAYLGAVLVIEAYRSVPWARALIDELGLS